MPCGLRIVAADAPGVPDILDGHEAAGGLVVPRDDARRLAAALGRVLDDERLRRRLSERARRPAEAHFSLEAVGQQLRAFMVSRGAPLG
jgi:glycosyltransferase involved in cell wall biosynthesis